MLHRAREYCLLSAAAMALAAVDSAAARQATPKGAVSIQCTPTTIQVGVDPSREVSNPIAAALREAGPGSRIRLASGKYPSFTIGVRSNSADNAAGAGGSKAQPVVIEGFGSAQIVTAGSDCVFVSQALPSAWITFKNVTFQAGYRSAVIFQNDGVHRGFRFHDCIIDGGYDHASARGRASKWGILSYGLADFEFRGVSKRAEVANIRDEHAFYLHNMRGDGRIENVTGKELGRTFVQITAREGEGPPGTGTVTVKNCQIFDTGLAAGDGYKGGSALTVGGRHIGTVIFSNNRIRTGFNPRLANLHAPGQPFGTSALVCVDGGERVKNGTIVLENNDFQFAPTAGDRALVSIGGCSEVRIQGHNRFLAGKFDVALSLDPVQGDGTGRLISAPNGSVRMDPSTELKGRLQRRGNDVSAAERRIVFGG